MMGDIQHFCPHCGGRMLPWANPQGSSWGGEFQYVCFNDGCPYFVRGWAWMAERYGVSASYRCRLDPMTGQVGPLPVWQAADCKSSLVPEIEETNEHAR